MLQEKMKSFKYFTPQEHAVVEYILSHGEDVIEMDAHQLAKATYTSPSTVVRMCKKLETKGYPDFRLRFAREWEQTRHESTEAIYLDQHSTLSEIIDTVPHIYQYTIEETQRILDKNALTRILNYMKKAKKIDFYSSGLNFSCTQLMCSKLNSIGMLSSSYNAVDMDYLKRVDPQTNVSFVISHTGGNQAMIDVAYTLRSNNIWTVAITGMEDKSLELICHERLYIASLKNLGIIHNVNYLLSLSYLFDMLYTNIALSKK